MAEAEKRAPAAPGQAGGGGMQWNAAAASRSYCNVASARAAADSVTLNFGAVQRGGGGQPAEEGVLLAHRISMNPRVAKRLHEVLARLISEHDAHASGRR